MAEEIGIDANTVCKLVRDYRRKTGMLSYSEEKGINTKKYNKLTYKVKEIKV